MRFTEEQNQYILDIYQDSCRTPRIAAELFEKRYGFTLGVETIRKKWKESGLELQTQGGCRNTLQKKARRPVYDPSSPYAKYQIPRARKL